MSEWFSGEAAEFLGELPLWAYSLLVFAVSLGVALLAHRMVFNLLARAVAEHDLFWRSLVAQIRTPMLLLAVMLALMAASAIAPLGEAEAGAIRHALIIALIVLVALMASVALHVWMGLHLRRFRLDAEDNLLARKHVTQTRILRRVADTLIVIVAFGAVLMTFDNVRQYGVSLLASAGAAGIILGLALQTVLKNLLAGIQLALTQPIRIDDVLVVEGEWGNVEEITSTYVVLKLWDWRRLIVPLSYFIEEPFQNWTRESSAVIGTVTINLDYSAPVEPLRAKARDIAEQSPLWDRNVFAVQVTDFTETTMQIRIIASARNAGHAFDLRCDMREKLVTFLQETYPQALPRDRLDVALEPGKRE